MMFRILRFELKRAFSMTFLFALFAGCVISLSDVFLNVIPQSYIQQPLDSMNMMDWLVSTGQYPHSLYNQWIGGQARTLSATLFFLMIPLLAALPFTESYCFDRMGYIKNIVSRAENKQYLLAKYVAVFISAGTVACIPLALNFVATAMVVPALVPYASTHAFSIFAYCTFDKLFYSHPMVYEFIYLVLNFVLVGLIAEVGLVARLFTKNRYVVMLSPFILYLVIYFVSDILGAMDWSVFQMLRPVQIVPLDIIKVILIVIILFLATFIPYYITGKKDYGLE